MKSSMSKRFSALLLAICVTGPVVAADLSGTWAGTLNGPGSSSHRLTLKLEMAAGRVTGSIAGGPPMGQEQPIANGQLSGHKLRFEVDTQGPDGQTIVLHYQGTISGNTIHGQLVMSMGTLAWTVTKQ